MASFVKAMVDKRLAEKIAERHSKSHAPVFSLDLH